MQNSETFNLTVRKAVREDMAQVYKLIKELADYEKLGDQVAIDEKILQDDFDSQPPAFSSMVAELPDGHIIGYALYYNSYSTWVGRSIFLEDLYVQPAYRGNGVGKQLLKAVAKVAQESQIRRIDFHVLSWNPTVEFYQKLGAVNLSQTEKWTLFRMDQDCINKLLS
ncbi:thialysine N-epsilon-acetyltransferase isoform X2 [Leptinotarsa decemlineata]